MRASRKGATAFFGSLKICPNKQFVWALTIGIASSNTLMSNHYVSVYVDTSINVIELVKLS